MTEKKSTGFVVTVYSKLGSIDVYGNIETQWVEGRPVNSNFTTFYRSYTDENGVYHLDGSFPDIDQATEDLREKTIAVCSNLLEVRDLMIAIMGHD